MNNFFSKEEMIEIEEIGEVGVNSTIEDTSITYYEKLSLLIKGELQLSHITVEEQQEMIKQIKLEKEFYESLGANVSLFNKILKFIENEE